VLAALAVKIGGACHRFVYVPKGAAHDGLRWVGSSLVLNAMLDVVLTESVNI